MNVLLIAGYFVAIVVYLLTRPSWRHLGPSLLDSFVIGISLFAVGSILVWCSEAMPYAGDVMRIGLVAGMSGSLAAAFWSTLFRSRISRISALDVLKGLSANGAEGTAITIGLSLSVVVTLWFIGAVLARPDLRGLFFGAFLGRPASMLQLRVTITNGLEGYFAVGYVKQFRDLVIPILCSAAVLSHSTYRNRVVLCSSILISLIAILISGERLGIIEFLLCLAAAYGADRLVARRNWLLPLPGALLIFATMIVIIGTMTVFEGRLSRPPPVPEQAVATATPRAPALPSPPSLNDAIHPPKATTSPGSASTPPPSPAPKASTPAPAPAPVAPASKGPGMGSIAAQTVFALAARAVTIVPRENALSYAVWGPRAPVWGHGWTSELSGLAPGTQHQLVSDLAVAVNGSTLNGAALSASPLGLASDLYYNWGFLGTISFTVIYSLCFLLLDLFLTTSRSLILFASKLFMFFAIPLMYSPFGFLLYGGAVVIGLSAFVLLLRRGFFGFIGLRDRPGP